MVERFPMISAVCANVAACATNPAFRTNIVSDIATAPAAKPLCPRYAGPMAIQLFALADPGCTPVLPQATVHAASEPQPQDVVPIPTVDCSFWRYGNAGSCQ
jgi:hypothetical protein